MAGLVAADAEWVRGPNSFDSIYCLLTGCNITGNLDIQGNLTVTGDYVNVTVVDYNVTGSMTVDGGVVADNFSGVLFWTDLSAYPSACSAGQFVSAVADTLTCSAPPDNDTNTHVIGNPPYLSNDSTTMYFNETKLNETIDAREVDTNTHVAGVAPWLFNDSTTMTFNETHFNDSVPGLNYWTQSGTDLSYVSGNVGVGDSTPSTILNIKDLTSHTELRIDSPSGNFDSALTFYNQNTKEYDICMDDSVTGDELKFIRGSNAICSGKDTFTITQAGLEMGVAVFYYDDPIRWYRDGAFPGVQSAIGNNFFELDDVAGGLADIKEVSGGQQGQVLYVICSDSTSIMKDEAVGGNLQLNGDFDCSVEGVGAVLTMIYFDNAAHSWDWHETGRT